MCSLVLMINQNNPLDLSYKISLPSTPNHRDRILALLETVRTEYELRDCAILVQEHKGESTKNLIQNVINNS